MRKFLLIAIAFIFSFRAEAQFINNKLNLEIGFNSQGILGNIDYLSNLSAQPYLIGENLQSGSFCIGFDYKTNKFLAIGINFTNLSFESFSYAGDLNVLNRESLSLLIFKPELQIFIPEEVFRNIVFSVVLSPTINHIKSNFSHEYAILVLDESGNEINQLNNFELNAFYFGADLGLKIGVDVSNYYGLFMKTGYNKIFMSSSMLMDSGITSFYFQFGMNFRLLLNKRYNY